MALNMITFFFNYVILY